MPTFDELKTRALALEQAGDMDRAQELAAEAKAIIAPYRESTFTDIGRGLRAAPVTALLQRRLRVLKKNTTLIPRLPLAKSPRSC